jgi:hypothetical protein
MLPWQRVSHSSGAALPEQAWCALSAGVPGVESAAAASVRVSEIRAAHPRRVLAGGCQNIGHTQHVNKSNELPAAKLPVAKGLVATELPIGAAPIDIRLFTHGSSPQKQCQSCEKPSPGHKYCRKCRDQKSTLKTCQDCKKPSRLDPLVP